MVTDDGQSLDEYILQIFEEQEEIFYFPVTSQNTARNFVKALHNKGLPYERVYKEIGEFEHNFSAWRKGLGRIGIGHRVIERINKPLEEVLLSDDEDDIQEILIRLKEKAKGAEVTKDKFGNDRVPPISSHQELMQPIRDEHQNESKLLTSGGGGGGNKGKQDQERDITDSWRQCIDNKMKALDRNDGGKKNSARTTAASQPSVAELQQKEPGVIDFRSVLKRHVENDKLKLGDRWSMPPSLRQDGNSDARSRLSVSLDRIHQAENVKHRNLSDELIECRKTRAGSEPRDTQYNIGPRLTQQSITEMKVTTETSTEVNKTRESEDRLRQESKNSDSEKDLIDWDGPNQEPLPAEDESAKDIETKAPLAAEEESDSSSSDSETTSSSESEKTAASSLENDDDMDGKDDHIDDTDGDTDGSRDAEELQQDVEENYDSEWDDDNGELSAEGRRLATEVIRYKERLAQQDGAGFVYVFSDNSTVSSPRIKIGASRFPKRRLRQALHFNINMKMLASFRVRQRQKIGERIKTALSSYKIVGHEDWFEGPLNNMLDIIKKTAQD